MKKARIFHNEEYSKNIAEIERQARELEETQD